MEQKKSSTEQKENKERELEKLIELVNKTDIEVFAVGYEKELMKEIEDVSIERIERSHADPEAFLEILQEGDADLEIIKESKLMESLQELNPSFGAAYLEKHTLGILRSILNELTDRLEAGAPKESDAQRIKEAVRERLKSPKGAAYFADIFRKGAEEADRMQSGLFFHPSQQHNIRLMYHEGIHAIQSSYGFHAAQMADLPDMFNVSKKYGRIKYLTELQDNKIVIEAIQKGLIQIPKMKDTELAIELKYFKYNLDAIKRYL